MLERFAHFRTSDLIKRSVAPGITYLPTAEGFSYPEAIADTTRRKVLHSARIQRHMDGNGHWVDNRFVERQWRRLG